MPRRVGLRTALALTLGLASPAYAGDPVVFYGSDAGGTQFSALTQITPDNAATLALAWQARTGDLGQRFTDKGFSFEAQPIYWQGELIVSTSGNEVHAFDAGTGAPLWRYDPQIPTGADYSEHASRGVSLWQGTADTCPNRIFLGTLTGTVHAIDAQTGQRCANFGRDGRVDLSEAATPLPDGTITPGDYGITSPGIVVGDTVVFGAAIGDNRAVATERGIVTALDVRSGAVRWRWDPVPRERSAPFADQWQGPRALFTGSANAWAPLSADPERGLVYIPTGSASPDFYGGERIGDNRYANSVVAVDVETGAVRWHQQLIHHDVWDYDTPMQPTVTRIAQNGNDQPAVLMATKTGQFFAFHSETGAPLYAVAERAVPQGAVSGEALSPTQPFSSAAPLTNHGPVTGDDAWGLLYFDEQACRRALDGARSEGLFTPPALEGTVMSPSWAGGANWGGVAADADRGIAVVVVNEMPGLLKLFRTDAMTAADREALEGWEVTRMRGTPYTMARQILLSPLGLPCTAPPWGKLIAINLPDGSIRWERPLGAITDLAPAPVPNFEWGVPSMGGALLTQTGLLVIGAAAEHRLRVFATDTGELLHSIRLPAGAQAIPMSYEHEGRQYIAIVAGGHSAFGLTRGDYLLSFALPGR